MDNWNNTWAKRGFQVAMQCPICGFNRMSNEHKKTRFECSRLMQIRGKAWRK